MGLLDKINPSEPETCVIPYCQECAGAYKILILITMIILFYFFFLNGSFSRENIVHHDVMNIKVFNFPLLENCCSWWPLSHFFLFFVLGVLFPDCGIPLIVLGIVWELFEVFATTIENKDRQFVRDMSRVRDKNASSIEYSTNWWAGSTKDVVMDILGFGAGWLVAKKMGAKVCINNLNANTSWCGAKKHCEKNKCVYCSNPAKNI